jgi:hypothetical protein
MTAGARGQSRLPQLSSPNREERLDREKDHEKINILVTLVSRRELGSARQEGKASQSQVGYSDGKNQVSFGNCGNQQATLIGKAGGGILR